MKRFRIRKIHERFFLTVVLKHGKWLVCEMQRFLLPLVAFAGILGGLILISSRNFAWVGWKLTTGFPDRIFCEGVHSGAIRQPMNAWSSVAFIPIGLWVARRAFLDYVPSLHMPPVRRDKLYGYIYGLALVIMGIGSWVFHASLTYVGHFFDVAGMYFLGAFLFTYSISRKIHQSSGSFVLLYAAIVVPLVVLQWYWPDTSRVAFGGLVLGALAVEIFVHKSLGNRLFLWSVESLAAGFGVWILDETKLVCRPYSYLQGHALWHLLTAVSALCGYLYFRSIKPKPDAH